MQGLEVAQLELISVKQIEDDSGLSRKELPMFMEQRDLWKHDTPQVGACECARNNKHITQPNTNGSSMHSEPLECSRLVDPYKYPTSEVIIKSFYAKCTLCHLILFHERALDMR